MTQEKKELLLKDLSARFPYGVICDIYNDTCTIKEKLLIGGLSHFCDDTIAVRPYLRPMSSMTEEERKEIGILIREKRPNPYGIINNEGVDNLLLSVSVTSTVLIDWLLSKHFDVIGLIPKGLAIEVTEENNPYKE